MKESLIATWPHSTCRVLKIEVSFQVCWNCWWVVNEVGQSTIWLPDTPALTCFCTIWSWGLGKRTLMFDSGFCVDMYVNGHWFQDLMVLSNASEIHRNFVTFHSIGIFMPETNIDSTWTSMVGFGYFSWESAYFRGELFISREWIYKLFFCKKQLTIFTGLPTSTSIFAHRKKKTTGKMSGKTTGCRPVKTPFESWWFTNCLSVQSSIKTTTWTLQVVWRI